MVSAHEESAPRVEPAVATRGLVKTYGRARVVDGIDLLVPRGSVYGFLGPNGSGKTTTIRMLLGLVGSDSGDIDILGRSIPAHASDVLSRVGSLVEGPAFHNHLTGRANLRRLDAVDDRADPRTCRERVDAALTRVGLLAAADKRFRAYSLGMRQRLAIAAALLAERDLLILDEPTNGLDPQGTREIRHLISALAAEGVTVLVSSHLLSEIEQVCTHLGVMRDGSLVAQGTVGEIRSLAPVQVRVTTTDAQHAARAAEILTSAGLAQVRDVDGAGAGVIATLGDARPEDLVTALVGAGVGVRGFEVVPPRLEDLFVSLTGEGFDVSR
ncbi:ABC transporter ATP-binding protein [Mobilicoccus caccae]|uniref:ABC transporter ATP-binding protein n=1 Tax=Mobilicoccus caccae TaxID=1859295 RepID=A0ABQ6IMV5_9MICO|nr:ATP-binding cassette domain-containing protein [Mobilicoccus caccae]GMA38766.1 ABC transporter ATP-binding protein [Mobilicoccus caccae]